MTTTCSKLLRIGSADDVNISDGRMRRCLTMRHAAPVSRYLGAVANRYEVTVPRRYEATAANTHVRAAVANGRKETVTYHQM